MLLSASKFRKRTRCKISKTATRRVYYYIIVTIHKYYWSWNNPLISGYLLKVIYNVHVSIPCYALYKLHVLTIFYIRSNDEELLRLVPYFELDYLLPRTFVASMSFFDLLNVKANLCIPIDVMLAAADYFLGSDVKSKLTSSQMQVLFSVFSKCN